MKYNTHCGIPYRVIAGPQQAAPTECVIYYERTSIPNNRKTYWWIALPNGADAQSLVDYWNRHPSWSYRIVDTILNLDGNPTQPYWREWRGPDTRYKQYAKITKYNYIIPLTDRAIITEHLGEVVARKDGRFDVYVKPTHWVKEWRLYAPHGEKLPQPVQTVKSSLDEAKAFIEGYWNV